MPMVPMAPDECAADTVGTPYVLMCMSVVVIMALSALRSP